MLQKSVIWPLSREQFLLEAVRNEKIPVGTFVIHDTTMKAIQNLDTRVRPEVESYNQPELGWSKSDGFNFSRVFYLFSSGVLLF